ncbi:NPCBM-associated, NEW3 domain of alpha-galactosidase [Methanosarcina horonobensis HB-1 = JCM 15518]|uniref:NPCBM-associated, NEW3 domain of alpha-galactosidase n=1 Tax=Methanosarcina horonobensis HB-1 = JCM 15518 TaxID=1434110 RepID=A0A0E3SB30_9EURY|nr:COG1361 S-layer family protein [Methanosarcina horonobensis]AKB78989.1 NPCBM-associated, NEW3 domain of alpha-galactosidase [Methanosarcina horonobensis HB-1 = JCM 15518]
MKKFSLLTILLIFSAFICLGAGTALGASNGNINSSSMQVNLTNQNPDSARPGEPVELTVSVQNVGTKDVKDISVTVKPEYPFTGISGQSLEKSISYLNARQDTKEGGVLKFKLMTDANASAGTYDIDIVTTYKSGSGSSSITYTTTKTITIEVRGKEYAQIVTIDKANIDIAKEETLEFIVTNTGTSPLKNMVVSWKDPDGVILPVYSDNTKYIKYLDAGDSVTIVYSVMADVNADPGLYTLDINLVLEDYESNEQIINTTAGVFVGGETDFDVSFSESDEGEISLSVANVGNNIAYSVKVSVPKQDNYKVSGSSSTIVGNLEKGDYTIASFDVTSTQGALGTEGGAGAPGTARASTEGGNLTAASVAGNPLKVQIEYTDAKGERITVDKEVELEITGGSMPAQGKRASSNSGTSYLPYIAVIMLAGGAFVYRKKIQERIQAQRQKKPGNKKPEVSKKPEEQNSGLKAPRD